ncbi:shikimate 5-dehydrogenase [Marinitoga arctica]
MINILKLGIIQYPKKESLSEKVFNRYFRLINENTIYEGINLEPRKFDLEIKNILEKYYGINITVPYKEKVFKYIHSATESAIFLSAVNTIFSGIGHNTDWIGFYNSIKEENLNGNILVFGAGGAAKAVLYGLYKLGVDRLTLINRTYERALGLKKLFNKKIKIDIKEFSKLNLEMIDVFINTTSLGMFNEKIPIKLNEKIKLIYDVVYYNTPLQKEAKTKGIKVINGEKMWYYQAVENLKIWNLYDSDKFDRVFKNLKL